MNTATNQHKPWGKVHRDHKLVDSEGVRRVLVNDNGASVLVEWHGPKK